MKPREKKEVASYLEGIPANYIGSLLRQHYLTSLNCPLLRHPNETKPIVEEVEEHEHEAWINSGPEIRVPLIW
jgi:hypothetical protein